MKKLNREKLEKVLNDRLDFNIGQAKLAGGEIVVIQSGERLVHITKGVKNADTGEALEPNAMYRLASMTKPITGLATLIAVKNGWFRLDDDVKDYLPNFGDMDVAVFDKEGKVVRDHKAHSELKIYQMLCHSNGILAETPLGNAMLEACPPSTYESIDGMLDYAYTQPLAFDPGEYTAYTGYTSFDAIAKIIEEKSGMKYSEFLQKNIFDPLDIHDITYHPTDEQWNRMVTMHDRSAAKKLVTVNMGKQIFENYALTYECAGAGLAGCMEDYAKIAQLICNGGNLNGVEIVTPELIAEMKKPRVADDIPGREPNDSWGLGVRVKVHEDWLPEGAFGWSGAYGTHFWVDQENEIVGILLRNMRWYDTHGAGEMGKEFEQDVMSCAE